MGDKEDYLTSYREFFENFAATVNPEDQLPVNIAGYTITEAELPGEVLYWTTQYLAEKQCPLTLMTPLRRIILDEVQVASKKQPNEFGYKSDESVYIALRLMQAVTARVNDVCLRYLDNSRLDSLPPPPPPELRELKTVSIATKNSRRVMEDRHVEIGNLEALFGIETTEPTSFYAVYDGHAGSAAAMYCAAHVHQYLVESPHYKTDLRRALRDAFLRTDADFVRKSNQERACGGSTAVAVALRGRRLLAAWAGDSLALLAKRMRLMQLVRAHKPGRQDERDRIEQSGGTVMFWGTWRVNGQLAVSRAIGDAQYKPYVTARPETTTVDLDGDEDFVVVACDGLWDFVSEDDVALTVYRQIAADPDDLKAVTKRLVVLAKRQGSADNISIIVVFLKDPREIAADNCPPMDLGLDNALANAPPFVMEAEACKRLDGAVAEAEAECADGEPDNGVDNSDSDSEDLGPETAVDADDLDSEARLHPQPPTPPAHAVEENHVDGGLVDNVAESGEDSEDEWNYFKGEGETDGGRREDTPCQDNSAWETSSVDMNSSPLNPDAPPFVPGVAGDVVLAESPRKPLPMDDAELPDVAQFSTEARMHPNELLDLDNCDQLNGHHNVSLEEATKEQLNGNEKGPVDSLGFGFGADQPALIHDLQRVQHDTMDFCNIQVFQTHNETNPFASDGNDELFERLKNKERDPMSMSFYQEKDDDTCERLAPVDLNAVQPLPDSDDEDIAERTDFLANKENQQPQPDNDLLRFAEPSAPVAAPTPPFGDNFASNIHAYSDLDFQPTQPAEAPHTDTPESHKLLFEQIPEIPDGKSSELGFSNDDALDPSESDRDARATPQDETSQDVDMESKLDDSPSEELQPKMTPEPIEHEYEASQAPVDNVVNEMREIIAESEIKQSQEEISVPEPALSPRAPPAALTPEHDVQHNIVVDVHHNHFTQDEFQDEKLDFEERLHGDVPETEMDVPVPEIQFETQSALTAESPLPSKSPLPTHSPFPSESPVPPSESPAPLHSESPAALHSESPAALQSESPAPLQRESPALSAPLQSESPAPIAPLQSESPAPTAPLQSESPAPSAPLQSESPVPSAPLQSESPVPVHSPVEECELQPGLSPAPQPSPAPSPLPAASELAPSPLPTEELRTESPAPADVPLPRESPLPQEAAPSPAGLRPDTASPATASPLPPAPLAASPPPAADARLSPQPQEAHVPEPSGPAPDIVPEEPPRSDLVTDIDIGIPESRAQEICVPVTSELLEPADSAPAQPPLSDTPIAADAASADEIVGSDALPAAAVVAAAAAVAATAATAAAVTKAKASPATKKSPTTPKAATPAKSAPKTSTTSKTPVSAKKLATPTTPAAKAPAAAKTTPARTPLSASKPAPAKTTPSVAKTTPAAAKTTPAARTTPAKPSAPAAKPAPAKTSLTTKVPTAPKPASASAKPAVKEATAVAKSAPTTRTAPAARPAPKPAAPRPATAGARPAASTASSAPRPASARPAPRPAPAAAAPRPKPLEKKPLTNGDVKPAAAKPAPRPAPIARPAPRPTPRAAPAAPTQPKSAAPLPAPRRAGGKDADKASKDLANKRITSKAAPPRTANTKVSALSKNNAPKPIKKPPAAEPCAPPPAPAPLENGAPLANGDSLPLKAPPSPPADSALLPDVIA